MDKKNTMLLTVIAVATLLVAVVGATFAYFSLTSTNNGGTTTGTTTTPSLGTVALNGKSESLHLALTATQMAQTGQGTYWATTDVAGAAVAETDTKATANVASTDVKGGDANATYTCTGSLTVKTTAKTNAETPAAIELSKVAGAISGNVVLAGTNVKFGASAEAAETGDATTNVSLPDTATDAGAVVYYQMTGVSTAQEAAITAKMSFVNTNAEQDDIANATITTDITSTTFTCTVDQPAA